MPCTFSGRLDCSLPNVTAEELWFGACCQFTRSEGGGRMCCIFLQLPPPPPPMPSITFRSQLGLTVEWVVAHLPKRSCTRGPCQAPTTLLVPQSPQEGRALLVMPVGSGTGETGECPPGWSGCSANTRGVGAREETSSWLLWASQVR